MNQEIMLITGGARSGKSRLALQLAGKRNGKLFVATGEALDDEMKMRIAKHREERDPDWKTIEEPVEISKVIRECRMDVILIDCITLWVSNLMCCDKSDPEILQRFAELIEALSARQGKSILVTNEVGLGIVPDNPAARRFRDLAGTINQNLAMIASTVILCVSGLPLYLKRSK